MQTGILRQRAWPQAEITALGSSLWTSSLHNHKNTPCCHLSQLGHALKYHGIPHQQTHSSKFKISAYQRKYSSSSTEKNFLTYHTQVQLCTHINNKRESECYNGHKLPDMFLFVLGGFLFCCFFMERDRSREIFQTLVDSLNAHNSQELRTQYELLMGMAEMQVLEPPPACPGSWMESGAAWT